MVLHGFGISFPFYAVLCYSDAITLGAPNFGKPRAMLCHARAMLCHAMRFISLLTELAFARLWYIMLQPHYSPIPSPCQRLVQHSTASLSCSRFGSRASPSSAGCLGLHSSLYGSFSEFGRESRSTQRSIHRLPEPWRAITP